MFNKTDVLKNFQENSAKKIVTEDADSKSAPVLKMIPIFVFSW